MRIKMRTRISLALLAVMGVGLLASCTASGEPGNTTGQQSTASSESPVGTSDTTGETPDSSKINVWSRDAASGTRGAFEEIVGFAGELTVDAAETSGNGDMAAKVGQDRYGIGYVSLTTDFASNNLKKIVVDGVEATEENTLSGAYKLSRPFNVVSRQSGDYASDELEQITAAFLAFLTESTEGLEAVFAAGGIVDPDAGTSWDELAADHPIVSQDNSHLTIRTAGSTSVLSTLQAALEAFSPLAGGVNFAMNHTGSGAGYASTLGAEKDGTAGAELGFASRSFKTDGTEEVADAMFAGTYCMDAVVVVVSNDNPTDALSMEQLASIFKGEIENWSDLS